MNPDHQFPNTRWSVILDAQAGETGVRDRALEQICRTYWLPIYAFARGQGLTPDDAEDLTQDVLAGLLDRRALENVSAEKGKLRSFLRVVTKNTLRNDWKKANRQKRGGRGSAFSLDCEDAEQRCMLDAVDDESPDRLFDRHWGINLLQRAMDRLEANYAGRGKRELFVAIKPVLGQSGASVRYQDLAEQLSISESAVKVAAHRLRKRFRNTLKEEIALTLDNDEEDAIEEEIRFLFGVFAR